MAAASALARARRSVCRSAAPPDRAAAPRIQRGRRARGRSSPRWRTASRPRTGCRIIAVFAQEPGEAPALHADAARSDSARAASSPCAVSTDCPCSRATSTRARSPRCSPIPTSWPSALEGAVTAAARRGGAAREPRRSACGGAQRGGARRSRCSTRASISRTPISRAQSSRSAASATTARRARAAAVRTDRTQQSGAGAAPGRPRPRHARGGRDHVGGRPRAARRRPDAQLVAVKVLNAARRRIPVRHPRGPRLAARCSSPTSRSLNMSFGGGLYPGDCDSADAATMALASAVNELYAAGVLTVAGAGNNGSGRGHDLARLRREGGLGRRGLGRERRRADLVRLHRRDDRAEPGRVLEQQQRHYRRVRAGRRDDLVPAAAARPSRSPALPTRRRSCPRARRRFPSRIRRRHSTRSLPR